MNSEYPFVLLGDHFYLASFLKYERETGLVWKSSTLHRKSPGLIDTQFEGNNTHIVDVLGQYISRSVKKFHVNLKNISETVGFDVVFVELGFKGFVVMTPEFVKYQDYDLTQAALEVIAKKKSRFSVFKSENINYAIKYLPLIPGSILEQDFHLEIITTALKSFDKKIITENKCLIVLSGELVWSGWLSKVSLPELVSMKFPWDNYYKIDRSGVWQYLIAGRDPERFQINKSIFDPELFCLELPVNITKTALIFTKEGRQKTIYPSGGVDYFDLKDTGWNYKSLMLPKYLLVKGIVPKNPTRQQDRTKFVASELEHIVFTNPHYRVWSVGMENIRYSCDSTQKCTTGLQSWVDRNDTLGEFDQIQEERVSLDLRTYEVMVVDGQILKKGAVIAKRKRGGTKIVAKSAGKISWPVNSGGVIGIIRDRIKVAIQAPFSGTLTSFSKAAGFRITTKVLKIPVEFQSPESFSGRVDSEVGIFQNTKELLKEYKQCDMSLYMGVIVKTASFREIAELNTTLNDKVPFAVINCVTTQLDLELDRFMGWLVGKFIGCEQGNLNIPWEEVATYFTPGFERESIMDLSKGAAVKFVNYECPSFYGKIEKHLKPVKNISSFLINSQGGFYECPQENILLIDHSHEQ